MKSTLFVFRHAQSTDNAAHLFSGWRNPSLTPKGKREALHTRAQLKGLPVDLGFSSSERRAMQTLRIVLGSRRIPTIIDDRIIERCYGVLQGQSKKKLAKVNARLVHYYRRDFRAQPPFGESVEMVHTRTLAFIRELLPILRRYRCNVAVSCHGNSMRPIRRFFEHLSISAEMKLENPQDKAMVYHIITSGKRLPRSFSWKGVVKPTEVIYASDARNPLRKFYSKKQRTV